MRSSRSFAADSRTSEREAACRPLPVPQDAAAARDVADAAGSLLLEIRAGLHEGAVPDAVRRDGDKRSSDLIVGSLRELYPADAVLCEETAGLVGPREAERVWIVDPLDGTREFGEEGRSDWAVHVALVKDRELHAGAVALPAQGVTLCSDDVPLRSSSRTRRRIRIVASRTRAVPEADALAARLGGDVIRMGSAGAKVAAVVRGDADVYVHAGGLHVWDSAAPVAVANAFGLHTSRLDGSSLVYGPGVTWLPDLVVCRPDLREEVLAFLSAVPLATTGL